MRHMASELSGDRLRSIPASRTNALRLLLWGRVLVQEADPLRMSTDNYADREGLEEWLKKFENRTFLTFVSRARAARRLDTRGVLWMIALSVASAASLCVSVISLGTSQRPVASSEIASSLFALATLVLSLIVSSLNFQGRSRDLFHSFRAIQRVSSRAESLRHATRESDAIEIAKTELESRYQDALDQSENHTTLDYHRARSIRDGEKGTLDTRARQRAILAQSALTGLPVLIIVASLVLLLIFLLAN